VLRFRLRVSGNDVLKCHRSGRGVRRWAQDLADELERLGLFDRMDAIAAERAKQAFARKGIDALWRIELGRAVVAGDAEDLAEGGIGEFLEELRRYLSERGVALGDVEDLVSDDGTRYDVRVGNEVHAIYDLSGADANAGDSMERMWGLRGFGRSRS
jgi:hypothetical protein